MDYLVSFSVFFVLCALLTIFSAATYVVFPAMATSTYPRTVLLALAVPLFQSNTKLYPRQMSSSAQNDQVWCETARRTFRCVLKLTKSRNKLPNHIVYDELAKTDKTKRRISYINSSGNNSGSVSAVPSKPRTVPLPTPGMTTISALTLLTKPKKRVSFHVSPFMRVSGHMGTWRRGRG